jgi:hypothetical protein
MKKLAFVCAVAAAALVTGEVNAAPVQKEGASQSTDISARSRHHHRHYGHHHRHYGHRHYGWRPGWRSGYYRPYYNSYGYYGGGPYYGGPSISFGFGGGPRYYRGW